jgi:DNA-binding beta-propeller fold protein YncE
MCILFLLLLAPPDDVQVVAEKLQQPFAVAFDAEGTPWFVEYQGHRLGKIVDGKAVYMVGTGKKGNSPQATTMRGDKLIGQFNSPHNLAIHGLIYIADSFNHTVRIYIPPSNELGTFAGTGKPGFSGDGGPAHQATFNETYHVTLDPAGKHLYVVDLKNQRVRRIDLTTKVVTTVAGNGKKGQPTEGAKSLETPLNDPRALIVDGAGQLYLLQRGGHDLWKIDANGVLHRLAGTGQKGYTGDGGPARDAQLNGPKHLCFDEAGNILIADTENHCIRRLNVKNGVITLVLGRGTGTTLKQPHGVTVKPGTSEIYVADSGNGRIVKLVSAGK